MSTAADFPAPDHRGGGPRLLQAVAALEDAAGQVRGLACPQVVDQLSDTDAARVAVTLAQVAELAQAGALVGLGRVAESGLPEAEGFVTAGSWWRARTRLDKDTATAQVRLARRLRRHYEATGVAWRDGQISHEHAELIAAGVDGVLARLKRRLHRDAAQAGEPVDPAAVQATLEEARAGLETELLTLSRSWGPDTLRVALKHARLVADPDGASKTEMDAETDSRVKLVEVGDMAVLTAHLTRELGAKLRTVLDHYRTQLHHRGSADDAGGADQDATDSTDTGPDTAASPAATGGRRRAGEGDDVDPVTGDPVVLSNGQRDAAALGAWIDATLDAGLGSDPVGERPHLDIVATLADLAAGVGTGVLERTGSPIPATSTERVACDADVRLILVDGQYRDPHTGQPVDDPLAALLIAGAGVLDYGRAHRIVPKQLRRLLARRDRGCVFPGCHRPPQHCQVHHVTHWLHLGVTNLENCVLLCSRHHHFIHDSGWTMVPRPEVPFWQPGHWQFVPPEQQPQP